MSEIDRELAKAIWPWAWKRERFAEHAKDRLAAKHRATLACQRLAEAGYVIQRRPSEEEHPNAS